MEWLKIMSFLEFITFHFDHIEVVEELKNGLYLFLGFIGFHFDYIHVVEG